MSLFCETMIALNLTFGVYCITEAEPIADLPSENKLAISTPTLPKPVAVEPKAKPKPEINWPVLKVDKPLHIPAPKPKEETKAPPKAATKQPSAIRQYLEANLGNITYNTGASLDDGYIQGSKTAPKRTLPSFNNFDDGIVSVPRDSRYSGDSKTSSFPVDNSRIFTTDRYISGVLETGFNSQLADESGGGIVIQVSRDLYGYHSRNILIPKGSRLVCDYTSPEKEGDSRVGIVCKRILMGGYRSEIQGISANAGDVQGRSGLSGEVDNRFWEKYGTAFLLTGISTGVRLGTAAVRSENNSITNQVIDAGGQELSDKLGLITAEVLDKTLNLKPIITIPQGTRVQIRPSVDWYIPQPN